MYGCKLQKVCMVHFQKSAAYKSKYILKHLLSQNKVHFTKITKSGSKFEVCFFGLKKYQREKSTFFGNLTYTNQNTPSNLFGAKIWCILLQQQSQGPNLKLCKISSTISTELKSSSPFGISFNLG